MEIDIEKRSKEKKENKKIVIYHHDVDGLTSASLILRAIRDNFSFIPQDPNENFPEIDAKNIYIVDVAISQKTFSSLQNLKSDKIIWLDHHKPFVEISSLHFPENVQVVLDPASPSAVRLVRQYFNLQDEISAKVEQLGTDADTWHLTPSVQEWMDLDSAFTFMKKDKTPIIEALALGEFEISGELKNILEMYRAEKEQAKKELLKNTIVQVIKGHSIAVGLAPEILSGSESADIVMKSTNSEIQVIVKPEGWMSFRRKKDSTVNLLTLAKIFGGGGHEYASGAELGKTVTLESFPKIAEAIFEKIAEVL